MQLQKSYSMEMLSIDIVSLVIDTVGGWIDFAFEMSNNTILQDWADDVIRKSATHSEDLVTNELSSTPELASDDYMDLDPER